MADQCLAQFGDAYDDVGGRHQLADQQKERNRHQRLEVDPVEQLSDNRLKRDWCERGTDQDPRDQG